MFICDICNRTYHWQYLLKTSCCNATEREAINANDSWACPACINLNHNEKESCIHFQKREIVEVSWNPTWELEELQKHVWKLQAEPQKLSRANYHAKLISARTRWTHKWSSKRRFSAIQEGNAYQPYNGDLQNKVSFDIQPTNPQADITATGHCEYWITGSQPLISWIIK